jgi:Trypsin-co-occurring domain 1
MSNGTSLTPVKLPSGRTLQVETRMPAVQAGEEEEVAFHLPAFKGVADAIEEMASAIGNSLEKVTSTSKTTVEFGVEVAVEAGQLTALLVKGSGTANITVTLEWGT